MSNTKASLVPINVQPTNVSLGITKEDIAAVGVAQIEASLDNRISELTKKVAEAQKDLTKAQADLSKSVQASAKSHFAKIISKFNSLVESLGHDNKAHGFFAVPESRGIIARVSAVDCDDDCDDGSCGSDEPDMVHEVVLTLANTRTFRQTIELTKEQKELHGKITQIRNDIDKLNAELIETRRRKQNMPAIERKVRAAVVQRQLEKSDQGREFLSDIREFLEPSIVKQLTHS